MNAHFAREKIPIKIDSLKYAEICNEYTKYIKAREINN